MGARTEAVVHVLVNRRDSIAVKDGQEDVQDQQQHWQYHRSDRDVLKVLAVDVSSRAKKAVSAEKGDDNGKAQGKPAEASSRQEKVFRGFHSPGKVASQADHGHQVDRQDQKIESFKGGLQGSSFWSKSQLKGSKRPHTAEQHCGI